jgi:segregation and condensation protein A
MSEARVFEFNFEVAIGAAQDGDALIVDLDGYEGPLHVLLNLARAQKVDLLKLSVTRLADQYLAFVREARRRRFVLAADYLVMAAWLAYLKSRLLLPKPRPIDGDELPAEEVAQRLAFRLAKLEAMRRAIAGLNSRDVLRRDVFTRGDPQAVRIVSNHRLEGDLYGLMTAYIEQRKRVRSDHYRPPPQQAYRLDDARDRLRGLLPELVRWTPLSGVAPETKDTGPTRASCVASTLSASLELVREGNLEARQLDHFQEVYLRARKAAA